jgi:superfamily II DNA or RNA helicase
MITLRPYQAGIVTAATEALRAGHRRIVIQGPTGCGKTAIATHMITRAMAKNRRVWFCVHRQELLDQSSAAFAAAGIPHGVIAAGERPWPDAPVQVVSIQTAHRRLQQELAQPDAIWVDEAHHAVSATYSKIIEWAGCHVVGLTATPARLDGRGLGRHFTALIPGPSVQQLIADGYLSDYRIYAPTLGDMAHVHTLGGEFNSKEQAERMDQPKIVGDVVDHYLRIAPGTQAVAFAVNILHSRHIVEAFRGAGIAAHHVDGDTGPDERRDLLARFAAREFPILGNVGLIGEGLDIPGIETIIMARHTKSLTIWLQAVGRALRPAPGKTMATIIDHGDNNDRLGAPDADRVWTLDDAAPRQEAGRLTPTKTCPMCFLVVPGHTSTCGCGHRFAPHTVVPDHAEDILVDRGRGGPGPADDIAAAAEKDRRRREEWACRSLADFVALAQRRGYKTGWAYYRWSLRQQHAPRPAALL